MSAPDVAALETAVRTQDTASVRDLLKGATEKDRRTALKSLRSMEGPKEWLRDSGRFGWHLLGENLAWVAVLIGCGGHKEALAALQTGSFHARLTSGHYDVLADVLAERDPAWARQLLIRKMERRYEVGVWSWPLARRLIRRGVISLADFDAYPITMIYVFAQEMPRGGRSAPRPLKQPTADFGDGSDQLARALLDDPGLLEDEVWRLFTTPGVGAEIDAGFYGHYPSGAQWAGALAILAGQGHLERSRLIDASLDAFLRDFPPNHVAWYAAVHDRLAPTLPEKAARPERYLALLSAPGAPGVALAQRTCAELLDAEQLDVTSFLAASHPTLVHPTKSVANAQLKLIGKIAARGSAETRAAALAAAAEAFAHPREDIQASALKLIAKHGLPADGAQREAIIQLSAFLSPVLRPEATALGLDMDEATESVLPAGIPTVPLPELQRVVPVTDPEELVRLFAQLMEDASDPLAVERALDSAVRLSVLPLPEREKLAQPLLSRARKQTDNDYLDVFTGYWPTIDMAALTLTWATGAMPPLKQAQFSMVRNKTRHAATPKASGAILAARGWEACGQIADGRGYPLLATPEFGDGSISHDTLLARLAQWPAGGPRPPRTDMEVAMLRLEPGAEAILPADLLTAYAPAQAIRQLVIHVMSPKSAERPAPGYPAVLARYEPDGQAISMEASWVGYLATDLRPDKRLNPWYDPWHSNPVTVAALPLLTPHQPDLARAHLLIAACHGLVSGRRAAPTALAALPRLRGPLGPVGHAAVVTGLAGAEPDTRIAAADAWIQLAQQGSLDPAAAAKMIAEGIQGAVYKPNRLAEGLRYAAQDPAAATTVAQACVPSAASLLAAPDRPTGLHLLLEVAAQAGATAGLPDLPPPITELANGKSRTKLAEAARRLTALKSR